MLDINKIRNNPNQMERELGKREPGLSLDRILTLDEQRRELIKEVEDLRHQRNEGSQIIGELKKKGKDSEAEDLIENMARLGEEIDNLESQKEEVEKELKDRLARLPNVPHSSVPVSENEEDKVVLDQYKSPSAFEFQPQNHLELGENLGLLDFEKGAKIAGARFPYYQQDGALLEMALIQFMFFYQATRGGYEPVLPPFLANEDSYFSSGHLPKFEDELYHCPEDQLYLNPTAESMLANIHRDEILSSAELPKKYSAYTTCFRREAGSYGEEERGLIRTHQFNKVELFKLVKPEESYRHLDLMVEDAEVILQELDLHYRKVLLPTSDLAQQSSKTIDLEVWLPAQGQYYEVSSCSNCETFQARRGNIRYRPEENAKPEYIHTLNGSALATSRLFAAILENNQARDGSVTIPEALRDKIGKETFVPDGTNSQD
ncbi:MAG: serine--tRNA ligase [Candidatus Bipolaricaulota bacterium]